MEKFLLATIPPAVTAFMGYSAARHQQTNTIEQHVQAYEGLSTEHEVLKADLLKSGFIIRGTHKTVFCNPLNTFFNRLLDDGNETGMQALVHTMSDRFDINGLDENGATALHIAARKRNERCMEYLQQHGANPNIPDIFGMTPFHYAAQANDISVMAYLLTLNADADAKRIDDGLSPLMLALKSNKREAIEFLLALKYKRAEIERAPSPDHSVSLLSALRFALAMKKESFLNPADSDTNHSLELIFHAFLERNPDCPICYHEIPATMYITSCCQKGVCPTCAPQLPKHVCSFCCTELGAEPFIIFQRDSPPHTGANSSSSSHSASSSS
jgi:ankyrin repeat protein